MDGWRCVAYVENGSCPADFEETESVQELWSIGSLAGKAQGPECHIAGDLLDGTGLKTLGK